MVVRKKRFGTIIKSKIVTTKLESWKSFTQEMNELGVPFMNYLVKTNLIKADEKISNILGIKINETNTNMSYHHSNTSNK